MEARFYLHGTHPHADPMIFDIRYQFYWFDRSGLESLTFLPLNHQFYDLTSPPGVCQSSRLFYRSSSSFGNWSETGAIRPYWVWAFSIYFRLWPLFGHTASVAHGRRLCVILWPGQSTTPGVAYGLPYMDDMPGRSYRALAQVKLHRRLSDLGVLVVIVRKTTYK